MGSQNHWTLFLAVLFTATLAIVQASSKPCIPRSFPNGQVCVCNATYCDTLEGNLTPSTRDQVVVVTTSSTGTPFVVTYEKITNSDKQPTKFSGTDNVSKGKLTVNEQIKYQKMVGFGGAHTGAVTYLLQQLPQSLQDYIYESYYSPTKGIGYTMTRVPIGGSDFDREAWVYNELPTNDKRLSNFTKLDQRDLDRIEQFRRLKLVTGQNNIKYLGSAWSSPNWMKPLNEWNGLSHILPQYFDTWADYHIRYLQYMKNQGVDFWAITTGNEPLNGNIFAPVIGILSLGWTAELQAKWVAEYLGPKLRSSNVSNVKIFAGDDQRYLFPSFFQEMEITNEKSLDYLDGFAVHFYFDSILPPSLLDDTMRLYPSKVIINTESCVGIGQGPLLGSWVNAQTYILSYIEDLTHSVSGWIDWNLILDPGGGPNYAKNWVDSPIITNSTSGEIYKQPMFYAIGHFSRFIQEGSVRIDLVTSNEMVKTVGFRRPDGNIVLVLYNQNIQDIDLTVVDDKREFVVTVPALSVQSVVYRAVSTY